MHTGLPLQAGAWVNQPVHFSADRQIWDRAHHRARLSGHARVHQAGESLAADTIELNLDQRTLQAWDNCIYVTADTTLYGDQMQLDLDSRTGTIHNGRIANEKFTLRGTEIRKTGDRTFSVVQGNYTTCHDCSPSWNLLGEKMDMEIEGYAHITNLVARVKDASVFWLPHLTLPMKTRRQSGVLFPAFAFGAIHGSQIIIPYYWAPADWTDLTLGYGQYTVRGHRFEIEARYKLTKRSLGRLNVAYTSDRTYVYGPGRWSIETIQMQEFFADILAKMRWAEVSDNLYPFLFTADLTSQPDAFLSSSILLSRHTSDFSGYLYVQRHRNLLNSNPNPALQAAQFDPRTVQVLPALELTTNDWVFRETPLVGGLAVGLTNFVRPSGPFDYSFVHVPYGSSPALGQKPTPGVDPVREATRYWLTPSVYTSFRLADRLSIVPSLKYRAFFYDFHGAIPNLFRGYLLFQTDLSAQLERVYNFPEDREIPRAKHLIRPLLTYSLIPRFGQQQDASHPFLQQIAYAQSQSVPINGYNFDDHDIVPIDYQPRSANYFVPLGHSLAYGLTTQWVRRRENLGSSEGPSYAPTIEFSAGQAINLLQIGKTNADGTSRTLTRFFSNLNLNFDRLKSATTYFYYTEYVASTPRHTVSTNLSWIIERSIHQRIMTYDRSFEIGYVFNRINSDTSNLSGRLNYSLNDFLLPYVNASYGFLPHGSLYSADLGLILQSPSQCWRVGVVGRYSTATRFSLNFDFSINLVGTGYGGVSDLTSLNQTAQSGALIP